MLLAPEMTATPAALALCIERGDAGDEGAVVSEVDVVRARRDRRLGHPVGFVAIGLERPRRVDDNGRSKPRYFT